MSTEVQSDLPGEVRRLALAIAGCKEVATASRDRRHGCHRIVLAQEHLGTEFRQSPEPWVGNLSRAKVLFVASNPSISEAPETGEDYPMVSFNTADFSHNAWPEERIASFHTQRFSQSLPRPFVNLRAQYLCKDDKYRGSDKAQPGKDSQRYWKSALRESEFILQRPLDMSSDICLTEVVHCKTKSETDRNGQSVGLEEALPTCSKKYLDQILLLSSALLIVVVGSIARDTVLGMGDWNPPSQSRWEVEHRSFGRLPKHKGDAAAHLGIAHIGPSPRIVCAMRHLSNGFGCGSFIGALGEEGANRLSTLVSKIDLGDEPVPTSKWDLLRKLHL